MFLNPQVVVTPLSSQLLTRNLYIIPIVWPGFYHFILILKCLHVNFPILREIFLPHRVKIQYNVGNIIFEC